MRNDFYKKIYKITEKASYVILLTCILSPFTKCLSAQNHEKSFSIGGHYSYAGISKSTGVTSGTGLNVVKPLTERISIGIKGDYYFYEHHEKQFLGTHVDYQTRMIISSLFGRIVLLDLKIVDLYGTAGLSYHWFHSKGIRSGYNDVSPIESYLYNLENFKNEIFPHFGLGLKSKHIVNFFVEPVVTDIDGTAALLISGGLNIKLNRHP